jgi:hypothetical protein
MTRIAALRQMTGVVRLAIQRMVRGIAVAGHPRIMRRLIWSSLVVALTSLDLGAQAMPDFSGTWTMDLARSEAAAQGGPIGPVVVAIQQTPREVRVETTRNGRTEGVSYVPAGTKTPDGKDPAGTFRWDGPRLVTFLATHINNQAVTFEETRSLNPTGTEMTVEVNVVVQHGYQTGGTSVVRSSNAPNTSKGVNVFVKTP